MLGTGWKSSEQLQLFPGSRSKFASTQFTQEGSSRSHIVHSEWYSSRNLMFKLCTMLVICVYVESFLTVHGVVTDCGLEKSSSRSHIADLPLSQMSLWAASSNWFASSEWLENLRPISNFEANQVQFSSREANFILQLRPRFNLSLYFATRLAEHFSDQHRSKTDASKSQNSGQKWGTELASKQASYTSSKMFWPGSRSKGYSILPQVIIISFHCDHQTPPSVSWWWWSLSWSWSSSSSPASWR